MRIFFEMKQKWTGLLIEPNPAYIQRLKAKGRRAWIFPHCISPKKRPMVVKFDAISAFGGIINDENRKDIKRPADINCILDPKRAVLRKTIQVRVHVYYMNSIANIYTCLGIIHSIIKIIFSIAGAVFPHIFSPNGSGQSSS